MKAITICQPFAHWIITGEKLIENRTWETSYRGPLLIHAGVSRKFLLEEDDVESMTFGAIIGICELVDCVPLRKVKKRPHAEGPFCFLLDNVHQFPDPIPYRGQLNIYNVDESIVRAAIQALRS